MRDLEEILDKVARASKTKEVKEALNAYCAMVRLRKALVDKYVETMQPLYSRDDRHPVKIIRSVIFD
ncbi:hypothetical protein HNP21_006284 [Bacillus aryabhattai]|uniref:Uncharacterized protein n=1 Tax=Priestia aryabhattai TaxID=412384 RepID=A0A7W3NHK2_PRIAR|nr:hypothetical protein [Priestia aryabhattai]MBA9043106.1 hypothetical protein [Priestia aryabhattai]